MHKLITAALLGAALATPLMAQGYPGDDGRHDRGQDVRGDQRGGYGYQGRQDQGQYRAPADRQERVRPDAAQVYGDNRGPGRGQGYDRGRPGGDGRQWDGRGRPDGNDHRGQGSADRGWDQRWRSDNRYDWRGYRQGHRDQFAVRGYYAPGGYGYRRFERGYRIAPIFYDQRYWIADPYAYRLPPADGPYRWVRYFNDVLLIDLRSGLVVDEEPGFFY